jgi:glycerol-3-phosphate dehydrogenase (NAD(P)+)
VKVSVIGAGGWGTAISRLLALNGHDVTLWTRSATAADRLDRERENIDYLPKIALPRMHLHITDSLAEALASGVIILAVPSFAMAKTMRKIAAIADADKIYINLAKGIDRTSHRTMSEVISHALPAQAVFTLSGPSHAEEVGRDMPTAVVLAGADTELGERLQKAFSSPRFRIYLSTDIRGVELCSTAKNIIAIATGISDGLGFGDNSRGALITRGLQEMVRFGNAFDTSDATFFGLSGLGDLVATCTSAHSRNRYVGFCIGQGESIDDILKRMKMVAEGVYATQIVHLIAQEKEIEMPITEAVYRILHESADPLAMVDEIMTRPAKKEGE